MNGIELPLGAQYRASVGGRDITVEVVKDPDCSNCAFNETPIICFGMLCGEDSRKDCTPVAFREVKGNSENN